MLLLAGVCVLFFIAWWKYSDLTMQYPRTKLVFRNWYWHHFGDPFDAEVRQIAGRDQVNCSDSLHDTTSVLSCVSAAQKQHRPFSLHYGIRGIDSTGVSGLVGASDGTTYEVAYNVWNGFVTAWRRQCPEPLKISAVRNAWSWDIHCVPPVKSDSEVKVIRDDWAESIASRSRAK
jgi:hypothetical protein